MIRGSEKLHHGQTTICLWAVVVTHKAIFSMQHRREETITGERKKKKKKTTHDSVIMGFELSFSEAFLFDKSVILDYTEATTMFISNSSIHTVHIILKLKVFNFTSLLE